MQMTIDELIENIKLSNSWCNTSYYTAHLDKALWGHFSGSTWKGVPYYIKDIFCETKRLISESNLSQSEILRFIANDKDNPSYFFVSQRILSYGTSSILTEDEKYYLASGVIDYPTDILIDEDILACSLACFVLDANRYKNWNFENIIKQEVFNYPINDYRLTKVSNIDFRQSGFIYDNKYYLYSVFIDREPIDYFDNMPGVFKIISDDIVIKNADLYFRLDERLSVPLNEAVITQRLVSEKFRGPSFKFSETMLEKTKSHIVHYDPETYNKLLMVIKKDYRKSTNEEFWHIELEQLPYIDKDHKSKNIITTFIHGEYYPARKKFRHIDFTKNQYPFEKYLEKHLDSNSNQDVHIDFYATKDCHYKIWCVENTDISEEVWYKLCSISLSRKYRNLFDEILEMS